MGIQNSHVKEIILGLYRETILDLHDAIHPYTDQLPAYRHHRESMADVRYVETRIGAEGLSFATTLLPKLGRYVDTLLSGKRSDLPQGISGTFLRSAFEVLELIVTESQDGREYPLDASTAAGQFIRKLRTVLYLTYKLELPSSDALIEQKLSEFVRTETEVSEFVLPADNRYLEYARRVLEDIVGGFDPAENNFPKHGPGAVATGERGDDKWVFTHLYESLHQQYPYYDFMYGMRSNGRALHLANYTKRYKAMTREPFPIARLCLVPKDSRGPRIISCEPLELQFMQQAVASRLTSHLEYSTRFRSQHVEEGSSCHINFADQTINARLALSSSRTGKWATIDLNEASDRVSQSLFESIWPEGQVKFFNALRSHATILPNGEILPLKKFAPMGSALCFPVESAIFYALSVASILESGWPMAEACRSVYVYGDDIIVKTEYVSAVMKVLEMHGLKVNGSKSFISGHFRESCGTDAWLGHVVTPVRIRKLPGEYPHQGSAHFAWAAYSSHLFEVGMPRAGEYCKQVIELVVGEYIPFVEQDNGYLAVVRPSTPTALSEYRSVQWSTELSLPTALVWTLKTKSSASALDGYDRLLRNILVADPSRDPNQVVDPRSTKMSRTRRGLTPFSVVDWLGTQP